MRYVFATAALILAMVVVAIPVSAADSKTTSGIYLTAEDFINGTLTAEGDVKSPTHKIELHDFWGKPYIHVTHGNERREYRKSEIYGVRLSNGKSYRFVGNKEYEIREAGKLFIYSAGRAVPNSKGIRTATALEYIFSVGAAGPVLPMTRANLKAAIPENHRFHDSLDMTFRNDNDLVAFDKFHNMYKVNRLLIASESSDR